MYSHSNRSRGQLVLLTSGVVAVALVLIFMAYIQLGYAGDQQVNQKQPGSDALEAVEMAAHQAKVNVTHSNQENTTEQFIKDFDQKVDTIEQSKQDSSVIYRITRNNTAATTAVEKYNTQKSADLSTSNGVITREAKQDQIIGIGVDIHVTTPTSTSKTTTIIETKGY